MGSITFDFNNMMADRIGKDYGISQGEIEKITPHYTAALDKMTERNWAFMDLPYNTGLIAEINKLARMTERKFRNVVVVGIGGSALGNRTLHTALPPQKGKPRIFILDNVDPDTISKLVNAVDFKHTLFNVITKSGNTAETMANFMVLRKRLIERVGYRKHKKHIIVTTDPKKGSLREIAQKENYALLEIPSLVGGRFSVLSSVGLFSAAVGGIDIASLLEGARFMDELCKNKDIWRNPGCMSAVLQYLFYKKNRPICVFMPYSDRLKDLAEWFSQLWAESLGKTSDIGSTPVKALGVTDQHSQLQLYMEGPKDKVIVFVRVKSFDNVVSIPEDFQQYPNINYLGGHTLNELIKAEQNGTELALTKNSCPNCTVTIDSITPFNIGALMYMLEVQTAFIGELYKIDAFSQPGVEESKRLTCALLGRPGYEEQRKEIEQLPKWQDKYCI